MSRPPRERSASKGRPKRRAAKTHFFKYQLATNPSRAEENDLKRALQESLEEQKTLTNGKTSTSNKIISNGSNSNHHHHQVVINSSTNSSDISRTSNTTSLSSISNQSLGSSTTSTKRTRSSTPLVKTTITPPPSSKRAKLIVPTTNGHNKQTSNNDKCDSDSSVLAGSPTTPSPHINKAIRTYSRSQLHVNGQQKQSEDVGSKPTTPVAKKGSPSPTFDNNLKFKRESKNYAYAKMTALKVSTSKSPSSNPKKKTQTQQTTPTITIANNTATNTTTSIKITKRRTPQWSLLGVPEEKVIYLRDDEPPKRLICYPAIRHIEGDVIQAKDSVLLKSGEKKTDEPYIAKVCAFWEDAETGGVMMSLFWYYRPEHTEEGRKPHHLLDEIFASRHRDVDSVECIEDKCYVLTFNEYCRYRKRRKMEQVNTTWSLTDVTIPVSNESYPRRNRIPDSDISPELVFCCRQIYDSRMRRLVKNPLINPKYGHI